MPVLKKVLPSLNGHENFRSARFNHSRINHLSQTSSVEQLIRGILKTHPTPLMLIRRSVLEKQLQRFRKNLPGITPYYAIKANPYPEVIRTFVRLGASFDVASANEMDLVLQQGASPDRIIFANTIKSAADIQKASKRGVSLMTYDNESELYKISKYSPGAQVLLRILVPNVGSVVELSRKFGADSEQAVFLLEKAKMLGLKPRGVSFHVGSQCTNVDNYIKALRVSASIFKEARENHLPLDIVDIGGGFPIQYFDHEAQTSFESIARCVRQETKRLFDKHVRFIAEPGRFLVGPAGLLITQVIGRTFRNNKNYYYINDGIYGDFSGIMFDHCKYEFKTLRRGQKFLSAIAGPTCDSIDTLSLREELPELEVENIIYVKNIGAYSSASAAMNFNGFPPAKTLVL